ncbi:hypothetical protein OPQ81_010460 [Rhizoctonia solani]|nr:hypothetical protein OPQ81_010460 [Rhizoctonia solani]
MSTIASLVAFVVLPTLHLNSVPDILMKDVQQIVSLTRASKHKELIEFGEYLSRVVTLMVSALQNDQLKQKSNAIASLEEIPKVNSDLYKHVLRMNEPLGAMTRIRRTLLIEEDHISRMRRQLDEASSLFQFGIAVEMLMRNNQPLISKAVSLRGLLLCGPMELLPLHMMCTNPLGRSRPCRIIIAQTYQPEDICIRWSLWHKNDHVAPLSILNISPQMTLTRTVLFSLLFSSLCVLAQETIGADSEMHLEDVLGYKPNKLMALIGGSFYGAIAAICLIWCFINWGGYMLTLIIGCLFYAAGLILRFVIGDQAIAGKFIGLYILMTLSTLLSPCAFIAVVYMLLGRLALSLDADEYLLIKAKYLAKLFVFSDIATLIIQAIGGFRAADADPETARSGSRILLVGLIAQLASFALYIIVFVVFLYRMNANRPEESKLLADRREFFNPWKTLAKSIVVSCIGILVRSIFRTIESLQGPGGHLSTHEVYFYVLDALPLLIAAA